MPSDADGGAAAEEPLDELDLLLLDEIRAAFQEADPMPVSLTERVRFALALRDLEAEVARLTADEGQRVLARGEEQSRTITFDSDHLTIMIRVDSDQGATVRVDGWLAPAASHPVELRTSAGTRTTTADEQGRFAFSQVQRGTAQLAVQLAGPGNGGTGRSVVTPALVL
jgi:hypothetical protein